MSNPHPPPAPSPSTLILAQRLFGRFSFANTRFTLQQPSINRIGRTATIQTVFKSGSRSHASFPPLPCSDWLQRGSTELWRQKIAVIASVFVKPLFPLIQAQGLAPLFACRSDFVADTKKGGGPLPLLSRGDQEAGAKSERGPTLLKPATAQPLPIYKRDSDPVLCVCVCIILTHGVQV